MSSWRHSALCQHGLDLRPEIRKQLGRIAILIGPDGPMTVSVIRGQPPASRRSRWRRDRMSVIESDQSRASGSMKRQRVHEPLWLLQGRRNTLDAKAHPALPSRIDHENLLVQIQKHIQAWIAQRPRVFGVSHTDTLFLVVWEVTRVTRKRNCPSFRCPLPESGRSERRER